ncbi:MAG: hypothetical protein HGA45_35895, partial [Chloroflexales bacterium]|nr:hypothetical protein [Chloroflexales bacterium]
MPYPIRTFLGRLESASPEVVAGCYTPATLGHLAQSLSRLAFSAPGGVLVIAEGEQPRAWSDVAL